MENMPGDRNVIFMSKGYGPLDEEIAQEVVSNLKGAKVNFNAFGIGLYLRVRRIDEIATRLTDVEEFVDIFARWDPRYAIEPLMENVTVYLYLNENGQYDEGEPSRLTKENESLSILGSIKPLPI
ncbi:hypothetical protein NG791_25115 [Laspinema sp. D1]|uniref:hypothetical protein n=1 Tax=Laspinema palackyanum TaxID=3231601 RepID=UPI00347C420D|nr:hypothetical protein [Laspinema sp. D2b]